MSIVIGADVAGLRLKDLVKEFLVKENFDVVDVTAEGQDFVDVTLAVASEVNKNDQNLGIVIDAYGAGPFMVATKIKGMVAAEVSTVGICQVPEARTGRRRSERRRDGRYGLHLRHPEGQYQEKDSYHRIYFTHGYIA